MVIHFGLKRLEEIIHDYVSSADNGWRIYYMQRIQIRMVLVAMDIWMIKTNADGDTLWTKTFGGSGNEVSILVQQMKVGGYIVVGYDNFVRI